MTNYYIAPQQFVEKYQNQAISAHQIIDVREPHEWEYYHLPHSRLLPMKQIPEKLSELPRDIDLYIICAHGVRSAVVTDYLVNHQFQQVYNVGGGMAAVAELLGFSYD